MNGKRFQTRDQLIIGIQEAINKVPLHEIKNACNSFMRRCRLVELAKNLEFVKLLDQFLLLRRIVCDNFLINSHL